MASDPIESLWDRLPLPGRYIAELRDLGERRRAALAEAQVVLDRVEELLPDAPRRRALAERDRPPERGEPADALRANGIDLGSTRVR